MTETVVKVLLAAALILSIVIPFGAFLIGEHTRGRYKTTIDQRIFLFFRNAYCKYFYVF